MSTNRPPEAEERSDEEPVDPELLDLAKLSGFDATWENDADAPPIEHEELMKLAQKQEWTEASSRVFDLTLRFRSWYDVYIRYLAIEVNKKASEE